MSDVSNCQQVDPQPQHWKIALCGPTVTLSGSNIVLHNYIESLKWSQVQKFHSKEFHIEHVYSMYTSPGKHPCFNCIFVRTGLLHHLVLLTLKGTPRKMLRMVGWWNLRDMINPSKNQWALSLRGPWCMNWIRLWVLWRKYYRISPFQVQTSHKSWVIEPRGRNLQRLRNLHHGQFPPHAVEMRVPFLWRRRLWRIDTVDAWYIEQNTMTILNPCFIYIYRNHSSWSVHI